MQTATQAQTQATAHQVPRTKIFSGIKILSFVDTRRPDMGPVHHIPEAVLTAALHLLASGSQELAQALIQESTQCRRDTAADVIEFILEMVKPTPPKAFVIDDDHKLRATKVVESALKALMPKESVKAVDTLADLLDSIFKSIR